PTCGYHCIADVPYGPCARQKLDIYQPEHFTAPAGVVIFFYGGDWQFGSKHDYRFVGQALSSRGFIAVLPDYRLYPEVTFPAFVDDGALAIRWVHDHAATYGGDPRAIFLMGHSAGAHIAALLTLDGHYLQAVGLDRGAICATAGLSGPYDFTPYEGDLAVFGMKAGDTPPAAMEPIHFVDGHEPPMLLVTGTADFTVDAGNTTRLARRIQQAGGKVKTIYYCGRGHVGVVMSLAYPFRWLAPTLRDVTEYFRGVMRSGSER
ncbi:MAG TPA: alpha/beta hydrolase, partial [Tepidisphaeraceae bacterium]|nr:alpha/beta hydrolase [Tepidisphaeraceae bacterium]